MAASPFPFSPVAAFQMARLLGQVATFRHDLNRELNQYSAYRQIHDHDLTTLTQAGQVAQRLIEQGALQDMFLGRRLANNRTLFAHLREVLSPHAFIEAARQAGPAIKAEMLGWALYHAPDPNTAQALLAEGADPTAGPDASSLRNHQRGYLGLARFRETTPIFLQVLRDHPDFTYDVISQTVVDDKDPMTWLLDYACPEAFEGAMGQGSFPLWYLLGHPNNKFRGEPASYQSRSIYEQNPQTYLVYKIMRLGEGDPSLPSLLAKMDTLHRLSQHHQLKGTYSDLFLQAQGESYAPNRPDKIAPASAIAFMEGLYHAERVDRHLKHLLTQEWTYRPEDTQQDPRDLQRAEKAIQTVIDLIQQGASLAGESIRHSTGSKSLSPLMALVEHLDYAPSALLTELFQTIPEALRPRMLDDVARNASHRPAMVRWAMEQGLVPEGRIPGAYSTAHILVDSPSHDCLVDMIRSGQVDLEAMSYEGAHKRELHAPLGIQLLRYGRPEILRDMVQVGWNPHRLFMVDGQELSLAQVMAQPPGRRDHVIASNDYVDFLTARMRVLHEVGVDLNQVGASNPLRATDLMEQAIAPEHRPSFAAMLAPLRMAMAKGEFLAPSAPAAAPVPRGPLGQRLNLSLPGKANPPSPGPSRPRSP